MHRLLMTSTAYRQSSVATPDAARLDPDNALVSRLPLRRLDAEQVHDALLAVAGSLDGTLHGPAADLNVRPDGLVTPVGAGNAWRRSVYVRQERKRRLTLLEDFDLPAMNPNCAARRDSTTATQALHLWNNGWVEELAGRFAARVEREAGTEPARRIEHASWAALGRPPAKEEEDAGLEALGRMEEEWRVHLARTGSVSETAATHGALTAYCHALLNTAAFLYID
jgi:hypothetical protein